LEFVSDLEYYSTLLLIPIFSAGLFLIVAFIEILENHGEILFINKKHNYTNKDFIFPLILAVLVGLFIYGFYFHYGDFIDSLPPAPATDCGLGSKCHNAQLKASADRDQFFKLLRFWENNP